MGDEAGCLESFFWELACDEECDMLLSFLSFLNFFGVTINLSISFASVLVLLMGLASKLDWLLIML